MAPELSTLQSGCRPNRGETPPPRTVALVAQASAFRGNPVGFDAEATSGGLLLSTP
jgi:hypothetical protein